MPPTAERPPTAEPPPPAAAGLRRFAIPLVAIVTAGGLLAFTNARWDLWTSDRAWQRTDDAYVRADVSTLSARISGNVLKVLVGDYQPVRAGEPLIEIDPADDRAAQQAAQAAVDAAQATLANLKNQQDLQGALIAQARARLASAQAIALEMQQEFDRQETLLKGGIVGTLQKEQQATANLAKARADVLEATAALAARQGELAVLNGQQGTLAANLAAAKADLAAATLRLGYTTVTAPFDGVASTRLVQAGDYVTPGTGLIAVVPVPDVYVVANFKETQLTRAAPGQPVEMTVDTFPGAVLRGHVERISPAAGSVFALLPPDNATGNFTKVVQRIPVRIAIDPGQPLTARLRAGMSVDVRLHVSPAG
ncbi:HlyD family secretion protein [Pseudoxanthobacter sp.]|uniref:HlyD family secretion protein n=1 Tax=Pseudoxanthobacter sp. TaxID=1925742 RepID=UPI002FE38416